MKRDQGNFILLGFGNYSAEVRLALIFYDLASSFADFVTSNHCMNKRNCSAEPENTWILAFAGMTSVGKACPDKSFRPKPESSAGE
ncbi:hypothetical protein [Desulfonatronum parangueonense]